MCDAVTEPSHFIEFGVERSAAHRPVEGVAKGGLPEATVVFIGE